MSTSDATPTPFDDAQIHRLLTIVTVAGLHVGLLQRQLDKDGVEASARTRVLVEGIARSHRGMINELRPQRRNE